MVAIIIIDMQKEFFDTDGILKERCIKSQPIITNIGNLLNNNPDAQVIWIKANYNNLVKQDRPSHFGPKECCKTGSSLSEFHDEILPLILPHHKIIVKNCYSSFHNTGLLEILKSLKETKLIIAGVTLNNCVYHTAKDASLYGFQVQIFKDCIGVSNINKIQNYYKMFEGIATVIDM